MNTPYSNDYFSKQPVLLQVLPSLHSGGVERGTIDVTKAAVKAGFKVVVASAGGYMSHQVTSAGGCHVALPLMTRNPFSIWRNIKKLEAIIKEFDVDIVHARSRAPAWSAYFAAKRTGASFITTFHGVYSFGFPLKRLYNKIMTKGEKVIAISEFIRDHMIEHYKVPAERIVVIPRGIDLAQFDVKHVGERRVVQMIDKLRLPEDKSIILLPGRLTRWKGQEVLLGALRLLPKADMFCVLLGDDEKHPNYRDELRNTIVKDGMASYVTMMGNVNDMPAAYMLANVVLSTSVRPEAFGRVPAEAGAMGRIVIAPDHGGAQEIIVDGETGFLVKPNDPEALAAALKRALHMSEEERQEMGKKAAVRIRKLFTVQKMCEDTLAVYNTLLRQKQNGQEDTAVSIEWESVVSESLAQEQGQEVLLVAQEGKKGVVEKAPSKRGRKKKDTQAQLKFEDLLKEPKIEQEKKTPSKTQAKSVKKNAVKAKKPVSKVVSVKPKEIEVIPVKRSRGRPKKVVS
jgi:glycosyltransferase involved in cell wall biosynthesis